MKWMRQLGLDLESWGFCVRFGTLSNLLELKKNRHYFFANSHTTNGKVNAMFLSKTINYWIIKFLISQTTWVYIPYFWVNWKKSTRYIYIYIYIYIILNEPEATYKFHLTDFRIILTKESRPKQHFIIKVTTRKNKELA